MTGADEISARKAWLLRALCGGFLAAVWLSDATVHAESWGRLNQDSRFGLYLHLSGPDEVGQGGLAREVETEIDQITVETRFGPGALAGFVGVGLPDIGAARGAVSDLPFSLGVGYAPAERVQITGSILFPTHTPRQERSQGAAAPAITLQASFRF